MNMVESGTDASEMERENTRFSGKVNSIDRTVTLQGCSFWIKQAAWSASGGAEN